MPPPRILGRALRLVALVVASLLLASCGNSKSDLKLLDETLKAYTSMMRWADITATVEFIDPEKRAEFTPTSFERERWKQVRIGGVKAQAPTPIGETEMQQIVGIDLINVNTQNVRTISTVNRWRYDAEAKKWWLMNGLPKIDR